MYIILLVLWGIALNMEKVNSCKRPFWRGLKARLPNAYVIFHIYSIQKLTLGLGYLLRCINIGDTSYLVIQAEHKCYTGFTILFDISHNFPWTGLPLPNFCTSCIATKEDVKLSILSWFGTPSSCHLVLNHVSEVL